MTRLGPMCRIQFSSERAGKRVNWTQTRRLMPGSLLTISTAKDRFRTICKRAIVADSYVLDGLDQSPPTIQIFWADVDDAILDPTEELVMLEGTGGYFEAVRYCMVGLQHVAATLTPFDKILVGLDRADLVAPYVRDNPVMDLSSLVHHVPGSAGLSDGVVRERLAERRQSLERYHVLDGINRDVLPYTNLDNSQLSAVHRIITKELSIIQGPPGTGKTFTSVQALQILSESQRQLEHGHNVIVVAAQTNHAVDQILTQLINLGFDNTVRLGGRTQDDLIKEHTMYNLRIRSRLQPRVEHRRLEAERQQSLRQIEHLISSIFSGDLIDPEVLQSAGMITQQQLESLLTGDVWASTASSEPTTNTDSTSRLDSMSKWLGDQCIETPAMDTSDPDFDIQEEDDVDFSPEDHRAELDDFAGDEEVKRGRISGKWVPIKQKWTGANPRRFTNVTPMVARDLKLDNLWDVGTQYRGAIYQYWQRELLRLRLAQFHTALADNDRICKQLKIEGWIRDLICIKKAGIQIVGCTTTGLCKYRGLLAALKPRTMLIEEAAETKEANIISALYPSLQQLILVGDHQQLAPSCDTPDLDKAPYYLRVSMFERLVWHEMPFTMLNMQRRMHKDLRAVLSPFYQDLGDHPVVLQPGARPAIPGMGSRSYMFDHTWAEGTDENLSKFNLLEAAMIAQFIRYLIYNGVNETKITVLTFYQGQRKRIIAECRKMKDLPPFTNVKTVDAYQGEENDIVILSLVRSNENGAPYRAGFVQDRNRGVVSISRARRGLFIFGNMTNLLCAGEESSKMWEPVWKVFRQQGRVGPELPLTCQQHGRTRHMSHPEDWVDCHGGCDIPCPGKLKCGHDCGRNCHWVPHDRLICSVPCQKVLRCGHRCEGTCGSDCRCRCSSFTGAYSNDEAYDDDKRSRHPAGTPFLRNTGRVGGLRNRNVSGRDGYGPPVVSNTAAQPWINFDARQHDAQQREARRANLQTPNPLRQGTADATNAIHDTFRQVTLDEHGQRQTERPTTETIRSPPSAEETHNPSSIVVATEGPAPPIPMQPQNTAPPTTTTRDIWDIPLEAEPQRSPSPVRYSYDTRGPDEREWEQEDWQ